MNRMQRVAIAAASIVMAGVAAAQTPEDLTAREREAREAEMQALIAEQVEMRRLLEQQAAQQQAAARRAAQQQVAQQEILLQELRPQLAQLNEQRDVHLIQLEQAREQLEVARDQVERAAQRIAIGEVPAAGTDGFRTYRWLAGQGAGSRAQLGAVLVDADGGALVTQLSPGGAADQAGVRVGDLVQRIDDIDLGTADGGAYAAVLARLTEVEPGDVVRLAVERGGDELALDVTTQAGNGFYAINVAPGRNAMILSNDGEVRTVTADGAGPIVVGAGEGGNSDFIRVFNFASSPWGAMELVQMTAGLGRYFDTAEGLLVVRGPAEESIGIEDGDVILSIGGRTPNSPEHAIRILGSFEAGETIEFSLMRDGQRDSLEYVVPEQPGWPASGLRTRPVPAPAAPVVPLDVDPPR